MGVIELLERSLIDPPEWLRARQKMHKVGVKVEELMHHNACESNRWK